MTADTRGDRYRGHVGAYNDEFTRSIDDPEGFWLDAAQAVDWLTPPERALDDSAPPIYRWYPGAMLNTSALSLIHI